MSCCVYWIHKKDATDVTKSGYVGVSTQVEKRFASHKNKESGTNKYLARAIEKYGWDNLVKDILVIAEKDYCLGVENKLRPKEKIGWNLAAGGGYPPIITGKRPNLCRRPAWNKGKKNVFSKGTIEKMRQAALGREPANKGKTHTEEVRKKMSLARKGKPSHRKGVKVSREIVEKIANKIRGRVQSPEEREKRSKALKGIPKKPRTQEHKNNLGAKIKGRKWYNNGESVVFCYKGQQPEGYVLGRGSTKFVKES